MRTFLTLLAVWLLVACDRSPNPPRAPSETPRPGPTAHELAQPAKPPQATAQAKPQIVVGRTPVAAFVAEQALEKPDVRTIVYVGASWCEPCQRFHHALQNGELDAALRGVRFIDYDLDANKDALEIDGYRSRLIPLLALPNADGRASGKQIEGSIKGEGAVDNLVPRLRELLASP